MRSNFVFCQCLTLLIPSTFGIQAIVKDIISKAVITQFKAHKSPISALCFDPSGTILVTASVQGHSINVFKIMPSSSSKSSVSGAAASYSHLYRLQRGFTNAVRVMQILLYCLSHQFLS